jgi:catechol 2,3-dioxygenase-like lactoylglutathione lyase family enzyme
MPNEIVEPAAVKVDRANTQFHSKNPVNRPALLSGAKMVARDLARSRRFYEEFCGLETVRHRPDGLLIRDGTHRNGGPYWYIEVIQRDKIERPQHVLNHWGIDLKDEAAVDRCNELAHKYKDEFGIKQIQPVHIQHGAYAFYMCDLDDNWWEFEAYRGPRMTTADRVDVVPTYVPTQYPEGGPKRA